LVTKLPRRLTSFTGYKRDNKHNTPQDMTQHNNDCIQESCCSDKGRVILNSGSLYEIPRIKCLTNSRSNKACNKIQWFR